MTDQARTRIAFLLTFCCHNYIVKLISFHKYYTHLFKIARFVPNIMCFFEPGVELQFCGFIERDPTYSIPTAGSSYIRFGVQFRYDSVFLVKKRINDKRRKTMQ